MTNPNTCFFSGHRIMEKKEIALCKSLLREEILNCINRGVTRFIVGGAIGFDTMAAETVLDLRVDYTDIKLVLYLPCKNHFAKWNFRDVERFEEIKEQADEVRYIYEGKYIPGCMQMRNSKMVSDSGCGIVYLRAMVNSGSAQTVKLAKEKGVQFVNIFEEMKKYID